MRGRIGARLEGARSGRRATSPPWTAPPRDPIDRRRYDRGVRRAIRIALGVVGIAAAVYGEASSTFGWPTPRAWWTVSSDGPRVGFEFSSAGLIVLGLALAAFTLLPRKRKTDGRSTAT